MHITQSNSANILNIKASKDKTIKIIISRGCQQHSENKCIKFIKKIQLKINNSYSLLINLNLLSLNRRKVLQYVRASHH